MILIWVRKYHMVNIVCCIERFQVPHNFIAGIQITTIDYVHEPLTILEIAKRDSISTFCTFYSEEIDLKFVNHNCAILPLADNILDTTRKHPRAASNQPPDLTILTCRQNMAD